MVPFAGWEMPVQYTSIVTEHLHTRSSAGVFDTSHMGEFLISGPTALLDTDRLFTGNLGNLAVGRCRYGFLLNVGGGIVDDVIVCREAEDRFLMIVNAGTALKDRAWITQNLSDETDFHDISEQTAMIALQGPAAAAVLEQLLPGVSRLKRFAISNLDLQGVAARVSRTGYTGEDGFEIFVPSESAVPIWDALLSRPEVQPVGLGARDTLRLEKGYPLYGNDINEDRNPAEAGLMRFVDTSKEFIGKESLASHGEPVDILVGFICQGRRAARSHYRIVVEDKAVGEVTSGGFSPSLKRGIGLGYMDGEIADKGGQILIISGRAEIEATIETPPFV
jgi:aminomethyltransferase